MAETTESVTVWGDNITLSLVIWRRFRASMPGLFERALEINPHLAELGFVLPPGTTFLLPIPAQSADSTTLDPIRLF